MKQLLTAPLLNVIFVRYSTGDPNLAAITNQDSSTNNNNQQQPQTPQQNDSDISMNETASTPPIISANLTDQNLNNNNTYCSTPNTPNTSMNHSQNNVPELDSPSDKSDGGTPNSRDTIPKGLTTWREAVGRSQTSSQLAMALYMLESSIAWDKSIMKAVSMSTNYLTNSNYKFKKPHSKKTINPTNKFKQNIINSFNNVVSSVISSNATISLRLGTVGLLFPFFFYALFYLFFFE